MAKKLTIRPSKAAAMKIKRRAVHAKKLVYVICAPRKHKYPSGGSRVIYIGTTKKGVHRVAGSMAHKALRFMAKWGVKSLEVFLVTCPPRPGLQSWVSLERDLLIAFRLEYGAVPLANTSGKNFTPDKLSGMFQYRRLINVTRQYA